MFDCRIPVGSISTLKIQLSNHFLVFLTLFSDPHYLRFFAYFAQMICVHLEIELGLQGTKLSMTMYVCIHKWDYCIYILCICINMIQVACNCGRFVITPKLDIRI